MITIEHETGNLYLVNGKYCTPVNTRQLSDMEQKAFGHYLATKQGRRIKRSSVPATPLDYNQLQMHFMEELQ